MVLNFKDTLTAFGDFKNKAKKCVNILKVYSIHNTLRQNTNVKKIPSDKTNGTKNTFFFLWRAPTH